MENLPLTKSQKIVFDCIENLDRNILICGKPGVGKSVLINAMTTRGRKSYTLAAPTGLAALNIGGKTLHSIFKLPTSSGIIDSTYDVYAHEERVVNFIRYQIKHLIIDEISMVRADVFDYIDRLLKHVKGNDLPFGGVQIIAVGDFFQLPPVVKREEVGPLRRAGYSSAFIFSSKAFQKNFDIIFLHEVLRQKGDKNFIELLDCARTGNVYPKHTSLLNKQVKQPKDLRIRLTCKNDEADAINYGKLRAIQGESKVFKAAMFGSWPAYPVETTLCLKVGAQVMVKMNHADKPPKHKGEFKSKLMNGTLGIVKDFGIEVVREDNVVDDFEDVPHEYTTITLENGEDHRVYRKRWERKIKARLPSESDPNKFVWREEAVASFDQMPLILAWAVSIHKSQGQSFDKVHIDLRSVFAPGQAYVALSRCRSLKGVTLETKITTDVFWCNLDVLDFFEAYENSIA